jgi:tetratricopeptide (TPR) repeat protein
MKHLKTVFIILLSLSWLISLPQNASEISYLSGKQALDNGNYLLANDEFTRSIETDPANADAYIGRGQARQLLKDLQAAIGDFTSALSLDPGNSEALFYRGKALYLTQDYEAAIDDMSRVLQKDPCRADAYLCRADARFSQGHYQEAIPDYDKVVAMEPGNANVLQSAGYAKLKAGDTTGACLYWQKSLELGNKNAESLIKKYCTK